MVQDHEGRWWAKSRKTGEWHYHDGSAWVRGTPPGYRPSQTLSKESIPERQPQAEGPDRPAQPRPALLGVTPTQDQNGGKQRRGAGRRAIMAVGLAVVVASFASIGIISMMGGEGAGPASDYRLVRAESGILSVEVPSEWSDLATGGESAEGEKGAS